MAWPVTPGGRGSCVRCVTWQRTRYSVRCPWGSAFLCLLCFVGADSVWRTLPIGVGVYVFAVFRGSGLGMAWPVGVRVYVFAVFSGSGLGTWPVGVEVYVFAVFSGSGLGT